MTRFVLLSILALLIEDSLADEPPVYTYYVAPVIFTLKTLSESERHSRSEVSIGYQQYQVDENPLSPGTYVASLPHELESEWNYLRERALVSHESIGRPLRWTDDTIHIARLSNELLQGRSLEGETLVGLNIWAYEDDEKDLNDTLIGFQEGVSEFQWVSSGTLRPSPSRDAVNLSRMEWKSMEEYFSPEGRSPIQRPSHVIQYTTSTHVRGSLYQGKNDKLPVDEFWYHEGLSDFENLSVANFAVENVHIRIVVRVYRVRNREVP